MSANEVCESRPYVVRVELLYADDYIVSDARESEARALFDAEKRRMEAGEAHGPTGRAIKGVTLFERAPDCAQVELIDFACRMDI